MSTSHRREQLLAAAATGTLGADEQAELDALLREDPQAREELEALRDDARRLDAWHAPAGEGWLAAEPSAALDARVASVAGPGPSGSDHDGRRSMGGARRGRLVLAAALLVLAGSARGRGRRVPRLAGRGALPRQRRGRAPGRLGAEDRRRPGCDGRPRAGPSRLTVARFIDVSSSSVIIRPEP